MKKSLEKFDRRTVTREPMTFVGARILSADGHALGACTLCNLSRSGAMLRATAGLPLQTGMGLLVDGEEDIRSLEIVWQTATYTGVRFLAADALPVQSGSDHFGRLAISNWFSVN